MIDTVAVLAAVSNTVTVTLAVPVAAASGVPLITPVPALMLNPVGSPEASYSLTPMLPVGLIAVIATPTFSEPGAVYVGASGAVRSMASVRSTALGDV